MEPFVEPDPKVAAARAAEARRLLAAVPAEHASYRELPPEVRVRHHLLDVLAILAAEPLSLEDLESFPTLWAWVERCLPTGWEIWQPGAPPTDDFQEMVRDGRPDMTDGSAEELEWLNEEATESWVAIAHGHDGHRFLFWDSGAESMTVYEVDNSDPDVVMGSWSGVEEVLHLLIGAALSSLDYHSPRKPAPPLSCAETVTTIGGCLLALGFVVALVWWLVR